MIPNTSLQQCSAALNAARRILLVTHGRPDGDALGSLLGLSHALNNAGWKTIGYCPDPAPPSLRFLPGITAVKTEHPPLSSFDLIVGLDYGSDHRTGIKDAYTPPSPPIITIDHHVAGDPFPGLHIIVPASSTAEILFFLLRSFSLPITPIIATCLLAGIVTDTGGFRYDSTTPSTLDVAAELLAAGAHYQTILNHTLHRPPTKSLWSTLLQRSQRHPSLPFLWTFLHQSELAEEMRSETGDLIDFLNQQTAERCVALLTETTSGGTRGNLRSSPAKNVDVARIARNLGGGGHRYAAGFHSNESLDTVVGLVQQHLQHAL